jgi:hypothetical protein
MKELMNRPILQLYLIQTFLIPNQNTIYLVSDSGASCLWFGFKKGLVITLQRQENIIKALPPFAWQQEPAQIIGLGSSCPLDLYARRKNNGMHHSASPATRHTQITQRFLRGCITTDGKCIGKTQSFLGALPSEQSFRHFAARKTITKSC